MSIDSRIRDAVDETLRVPVDVDHGLAALRRTHRQRRTTRIGAGVAVVALVVAGVLVRHHDSRPEPTPTPGPVHNGLLFGASLGGAVEQVGDDRLDTLPARFEVNGPFAITPDGRRLIYAWDRQVLARDLRTGTDEVLMPCPERRCMVAIDPTGTTVARGGRNGLTLRNVVTHAVRHYDVGVVNGGVWSADGQSLALIMSAGRDTGQSGTPDKPGAWGPYGPTTLSFLDLETGDLTPRVPIEGGMYSRPALSFDGRTLAFVEAIGRGKGRMPELRLSTLTKGDTQIRVVHEVGRCYCIRFFPAVTWSPDGQKLAVTLSGAPVRSQVGGSVYTVRPDGTDWQLLRDGHYQDALAWQPVFTDPD
jgi:Tol biopolymer transport system component